MANPVFTSFEELHGLMNPEFVNTRKINCIKILRAMTGEGLKETKDFFEQEWVPFINGTRTPPKEIKTYISEAPEFEALVQQVRKLSEEVDSLKSMNTRSRAATIFNDED